MVDLTFEGRNSLSTKALFTSRRQYKHLAVPSFEGVNIPMVDFWYEDSLYGKVDSMGNAIFPITDSPHMVKVLRENPENVNVLYFLEKPFYELKSKYAALTTENVLKPLPAYDRFVVKRSLVSFEDLYEKHFSEVLNFFVADYLHKFQKCIFNFKDVVRYYHKFTREFGKQAPITKTNFILLPSTNNLMTGLILDLDFASHSTDSVKRDFFSREECRLDSFMTLAARHGFFMDKNAPWRLVYNINTRHASWNKDATFHAGSDYLERLTRENLVDRHHLQQRYYSLAFEHDIHSVMRFLHNSYNLFFLKNPNIFVEKEDKYGRISKRVVKRRLETNYLNIEGSHATYWLDIAIKTRINEVVDQYQDHVYNAVLDATNRPGLVTPIRRAMELANSTINRHDLRLLNQSPYLRRFSHVGSTTDNLGHRHIYTVDRDGNGVAEEAYHPLDPRIRHKHLVRNWKVLTSKSSCYPDCNKVYSYDGVGDHTHELNLRGKFGNIYTTS